MNVVVGMLLGACCAIAIACGGSRKVPSAPPVAQTGGTDPRAEIEELDREITDELARAQLAQPAVVSCSGAACAQAMSEPFPKPSRTDPLCRPAPGDRCTDTCTLATSICKNQQRICELAQQLAGDDWAANKCTTARASCKAAHDACCTCVP